MAGGGDERSAAAGPDSAVRLPGATGVAAAGGSAPGRQPATAHVQTRLATCKTLLHMQQNVFASHLSRDNVRKWKERQWRYAILDMLSHGKTIAGHETDAKMIVPEPPSIQRVRNHACLNIEDPFAFMAPLFEPEIVTRKRKPV